MGMKMDDKEALSLSEVAKSRGLKLVKGKKGVYFAPVDEVEAVIIPVAIKNNGIKLKSLSFIPAAHMKYYPVLAVIFLILFLLK